MTSGGYWSAGCPALPGRSCGSAHANQMLVTLLAVAVLVAVGASLLDVRRQPTRPMLMGIGASGGPWARRHPSVEPSSPLAYQDESFAVSVRSCRFSAC